jgi:hypothetical protein
VKRLLVLGLTGCAPYVTDQDLLERADACAWSATHSGRATLLSATAPCDARWVVTGDAAHDALGGSLASVGDVDGDGRDDLAIGSPGAQGARGSVMVFDADTLAGSSSLQGADAARLLVGESVGDSAGASYTSLSSRDGQAGRELVVGAPGNDAGGADAGMVVIATTSELTRGRALQLSSVSTRLVGSSRYRAGTALAVVDSVDDDAFEELVVGAPNASMGASQSGTVFVVHSAALPLGVTTPLRPETAAFPYVGADCAFGYSIATFDGDPRDPRRSGLLVGAPQHPNDAWGLWDQKNWGRAWLFGDDTLPLQQTERPVLEPYSVYAVNLRAETVFSYVEEEIRWRDDEARIGSVVAVVPDMDGGGVDDLVLAGSYDTPEDVVVFVVRGEDMLGQLGSIFLVEERAAVRIVTTRAGLPTVAAIAGVHDLSGDGLGDLLLGDPYVDTTEALDVGRVHVFTSEMLFPDGADALPGVGAQRTWTLDDATQVLSGTIPGARFGGSIAEVGDLDGDGVPEIGVGAAGTPDAAGRPVGRVMIYRGGP